VSIAALESSHSPLLTSRARKRSGVPLFAAAVAVGVFALTLTLYLQRQVVYSGDDLQYLMVVDGAVTGTVFYHPAGGRSYRPATAVLEASRNIPLNVRYPLEYPTSVLFARVWNPKDILQSMLMLRGLAGAVGATLFFVGMRRLTRCTKVSLITTIGLATSVAYWTYATHIDHSITLAALMTLAAMLLVVREDARHPRRWLLAAAVVEGVATLYMITTAIPAAITTVWLLRRRPGTRGGLRDAIAFATAYGGAFALTLVLLAIGMGWVGTGTPQGSGGDSIRRATFAGHPEYDFSPAYDGARAAVAFAKSVVNHPSGATGLSNYWQEGGTTRRLGVVAFFGSISVVMALPVIYLIARRKALGARYALWSLWTGCLVGYCGFNWFWDPGFIKFWVMPLTLWWPLAAIVLAHLRETRSRVVPMVVGVVFVSLVAANNWRTEFGPRSEVRANPWRGIAEQLRATPANALFISPNHPLDFHVAYFARRDIVSTGLTAYDYAGNIEMARRILDSHVNAHLNDHGPIYVYGFDSLAANERQAFLDLLPPGRLTVARRFPELTIYELVGTSRPESATAMPSSR
jgi:hypothetical protein